jgi:hypothetical protein
MVNHQIGFREIRFIAARMRYLYSVSIFTLCRGLTIFPDISQNSYHADQDYAKTSGSHKFCEYKRNFQK